MFGDVSLAQMLIDAVACGVTVTFEWIPLDGIHCLTVTGQWCNRTTKQYYAKQFRDELAVVVLTKNPDEFLHRSVGEVVSDILRHKNGIVTIPEDVRKRWGLC